MLYIVQSNRDVNDEMPPSSYAPASYKIRDVCRYTQSRLYAQFLYINRVHIIKACTFRSRIQPEILPAVSGSSHFSSKSAVHRLSVLLTKLYTDSRPYSLFEHFIIIVCDAEEGVCWVFRYLNGLLADCPILSVHT